jgi:hypothetical protein
LREQLLSLYESRQQDFKNVKAQHPNDSLAGPFLMSPIDAYIKQLRPLLVIGQETNGWLDNVEDMKRMMSFYEAEKATIGIKRGGTPFWNITQKLEVAIGNDKYSCAWTNLSKFDVNSKRALGAHESTIKTLDDVLVSEIKIISPCICMFFSGPSFDNRIKDIFKGVEFTPIEGWATSQFCQLKHPDLPVNSFRSYHPKSLRLRKLESRFIEFFESLN